MPPRKTHKNKLPEEVIEQALTMYDNGMQLKEIQEVTGRSKQTIYKYIHQRKVNNNLRKLSEKRLRRKGVFITDKNKIIRTLSKISDKNLCVEFQKTTDDLMEFDRDLVYEISNSLAVYNTLLKEMKRRNLET